MKYTYEKEPSGWATHPPKRQPWESDIEDHKREFFARGGIIQVLPVGASALRTKMSMQDYSAILWGSK